MDTGPLDHHRRLVADDPAVVPRRDVDDIVGAELVRRSVYETEPRATGDHDADVTCLAPLSANGRTHVLGPSPAWLVDDVPDREVPELDVRFEEWKLDRLIRGCEAGAGRSSGNMIVFGCCAGQRSCRLRYPTRRVSDDNPGFRARGT